MGRGRRDKVRLTVEQRDSMEKISRNGYAPAKKILHARILLMCDEGEQATRKWTDDQIAESLGVHRNTVGRILFMFFDPHRGWRRVSNRDSRTRVDWAEEIRQLLDVDYPNARKIKLVCDNLNTHNGEFLRLKS